MQEPAFSIGIEEEYLLVDPDTMALAEAPVGLMEACAAELEDQVSPEFLQCQIEIGTKVCADVGAARDDLKRLRSAVAKHAGRFGLAPIAASCHPLADWKQQTHTDKDRYNALSRDMGGIVRRMLICGCHVHVGIDDNWLRTDLMRQMSYFLPHLLALSTSSPFWQGEDTKMASYRISVFDNNLRLTNWNTQFRALLGLPSAMGQFGYPLKLITERLVADDQIDEQMALAMVNNIASFKRAWQLPMRRGGRILEIRSNPMPDGGIVVTYTDITGRVEADEALQRAKESLEHRVAARTAELTNVNRELARAQALAEEANLGKTRFLAAAGHDISQPLNAARLYTSSLVERTTGKRSADREIAVKIDSSLQAVENIIGAVLDISRLDAGAMTPNPSVFSLGEVLAQVKTDFQPLADEKGLEFVVVPSSTVVESDRNLLRRLVQNLVSNALKYTKTGKVLVGVRSDGEDALICVHDTGIGISSKKAKTVFREFERLSEGARIASGLGLGLSIVDRISRVLGLTIEMKSRQNKGTMFSVRIPRSEAELTAKPARVSRTAASRQVLAGMLVACIDNEETILSGMRVLLEGWGAKVIAAPTQKSLLKEIAKAGTVPDVIIADYHLDDDHNGLDVIAAVRSRLGPHMFAILATADRSAPLRAAAANAEIHILNKPLKPAALRALLSNVSQERAAAE